MRRIRFDPTSLPPEHRAEWDAWVVRAERATQVVCDIQATGVKPLPFNSDVWASIKRWFFDNVFNGRCAYCEGDVRVVAFGDGEHWRPKGAVAVGADPVVDSVSGEAHPGYFWLAYEWRNLLPACQQCNSGEGGYKGKGTQFPILGTRVFGPREGLTYDELNEIEQPLLLHPFDEDVDPADHLDFDDFGQPLAKGGSVRGQCSIDVYNLDRPDLNALRGELCEDIRKEVKHAFAEQLHGGRPAVETLRARMAANKRYSLAAGAYIKRWHPVVLAEISEAP